MTMANRITIYTGPACAPCIVAKKRLKAAGITDYEEVDLSVDEQALARLKDHFGVPKVQTPIIHFAGKYGTIADLTDIITRYKENN